MRYRIRFVQRDGNEHQPCQTDSLPWARAIVQLLQKTWPGAFVGVWDDRLDVAVNLDDDEVAA